MTLTNAEIAAIRDRYKQCVHESDYADLAEHIPALLDIIEEMREMIAANELRTEMRESRTEMTAALNRIVDSVERSRGELLAEISSTRTELVSQIGSVRTDLSAEIREVRDQSARNNAQIQWMLGGIGAIVSLLLLGGAGAAIYAALS